MAYVDHLNHVGFVIIALFADVEKAFLQFMLQEQVRGHLQLDACGLTLLTGQLSGELHNYAATGIRIEPRRQRR